MLEFLKTYGWALSQGINLLLAWILWTARNAFASRDDLCKLERRISRINQFVSAAPSRAELTKLEHDITEMRGDMKALVAEMTGIHSTLTRIERPLNLLLDHHLKDRNHD